jgi:hypothetical protein
MIVVWGGLQEEIARTIIKACWRVCLCKHVTHSLSHPEDTSVSECEKCAVACVHAKIQNCVLSCLSYKIGKNKLLCGQILINQPASLEHTHSSLHEDELEMR